MRKYRIIIVENDPDEQTFMKEGLRSSGCFELLEMVRNGDVLFEWLAEHPEELPDVVLSDLNMPGKNGYDIIAEMKESESLRNIPVIITSTSSSPAVIDKCSAQGAAGYIVKPETFIDYTPFMKQLHQLIQSKTLVPERGADPSAV